MNDFEKTLAVLRAVGTVAALTDRYPYYYHRYHQYHNPSVVVVEKPVFVETPVVVETPVLVETPVVVEKPIIVEKPVFVETPVVSQEQAILPAEQIAAGQNITDQAAPEQTPSDYTGLPAVENGVYSIKLGGMFQLEKMEIPGYRFTAALLTDTPLEGSPLQEIGLEKGDVITRIGGIPVDSLDVLDQQEGILEVRYIKSETTAVKLDRIYIPTDEEVFGKNVEEKEDVPHAP